MNPKKMNKEELINEVTSLRARVDNLLCQSREADELNEEKASAIDKLKNIIAKKDAELKDLTDALSVQKDTNIDLTKTLQEARTQIVNLKKDATGMENRIAELVAVNGTNKIWKYIAIGAIIVFLITICIVSA